MTSIDSIKKGLAAYLDNELMPQIPDNHPVKKFATGMVFTLLLQRLDGIMQSLANNPIIAASGLITANGIDIDAVKAAAIANMPEQGLSVELPMLGSMTIHKNDISKLTAFIAQFEEEKND